MELFNRFMTRFHPRYYWNSLAKKNSAFFQTSSLVLSFDCDTIEDSDVAWEVHQRLLKLNVKPVYAVPGELLVKGEPVYRKIFDSGSEFINHGGREHTYFDTLLGRYKSCFFYDQEALDVIAEDIFLGHKILKEVLGFDAYGWRTPHFGTFQSKENLSFLYEKLRDLNYLFSTSTLPEKSYEFGSVYEISGMVEIPVTGVLGEPKNILDTWAFFEAPDRVKSASNYLNECKKLAEFASKNPVLINIYGDPCHIFDKEEFFEGLSILSSIAKSTNYKNLLGSLHGKLRNI